MEYSYRQLQNLPFNKGGHVAFKQQSSICIQYFMHTKYEILLGSYKTYHLTRVGMYCLSNNLLYGYFMHTEYEILLGRYKKVSMYRLNNSLLYAYFMHTEYEILL